MDQRTLKTISRIHAYAFVAAPLSFILSEEASGTSVGLLEIVAAASLLTTLVLTPFSIMYARTLLRDNSKWRFLYSILVVLSVALIIFVLFIIGIIATFEPPRTG